MLQELLLALAGYKSPLLSDEDDSQTNSFHATLSPSEQTLLKSIAHLGKLHRDLRTKCLAISSSHPSVICQAVATAVSNTYLDQFQDRILEIERDILLQDSSLVGAYRIVPFTSILGALGSWGQRLEWLTHCVQFISRGSNATILEKDGASVRRVRLRGPATGAALINFLQNEAHTGHSDLEPVIVNLIKVAHSAWLRQLSTWILYGRLPTIGASDFMIAQPSSAELSLKHEWEARTQLCPSFISNSTAHSILFIGKSIGLLRSRSSQILSTSGHCTQAIEQSLLISHAKLLSSLELPLTSTTVSRTISALRTSLSRNALEKILPFSTIQQALQILQRYFLLQSGEFAIALVTAADACLDAKSQLGSVGKARKTDFRVDGAMMKEVDVSTTLTQTWTTLATLQDRGDQEDEDTELDNARHVVHLSIKKAPSKPLSPAFVSSIDLTSVDEGFDDLLLATPTVLDMKITSPLDLFLSSSEVRVYAQFHAYLLAIRRLHLHLTNLWKLYNLRKLGVWKPRPEERGYDRRAIDFEQSRQGQRQHDLFMRPVWATVGYLTFFLAEFGGYLHGEVLTSSWNAFQEWLDPDAREGDSQNERNLHSFHLSSDASEDISSIHPAASSGPKAAIPAAAPRDPESLMTTHRSYLMALVHSLLMDDPIFTKTLRRLITTGDHLVSLMKCLSDLRAIKIVQHQGEDISSHVDMEVAELNEKLKSAQEGVSRDLENLKKRLRELDLERLGEDLQLVTNLDGNDDEVPMFVPWKAGGLDRLLMKVDSANIGS
ncbi:hypothetical protein MMC25_006262 [Agyrium rufum]|nr:hypothetical protein [Agyrium rufum]